MISEIDQRLDEFVDRDREMQRFANVLETGEKLVMAVVGPGGIGKSSLMARMRHECALRKARTIEILYTTDDSPEYVGVMRRCRDSLNQIEHFAAFTDLINFYTVKDYTLRVEVQGNVNVAQGMTVTEGASVNTIAGVVIKDSMLVFPRSDLNVSEGERRQRLTETFLLNLAIAAREHQQLVIFLDATEKMSEPTHRWFWNSFMPGVHAAGITNVRFVVLTRNKLVDLDRYKRQLVEESELQPLAIPDIILYLEKRGVPEALRPSLAQMVFVASKPPGNPLDIANLVDSFFELQRNQGSQ